MIELGIFIFGVLVGGTLGVYLAISQYKQTVLSLKRQVERINELHK